VRRRVSFAGGVARVVCPLAARRAAAGVPIAGAERDPVYAPLKRAFRDGLKKLGWEEGRNIRFDFRWISGNPTRNQAYAAELVGLAPDLMFAQSTPPVRALQRASSKISIVFVAVKDPVGDAFVASDPPQRR